MALIGLPDAICHKPSIFKNSDYLGSTVNSLIVYVMSRSLTVPGGGLRKQTCFFLVQNWKSEMQLIFIC